jgi:hypothetical protein
MEHWDALIKEIQTRHDATQHKVAVARNAIKEATEEALAVGLLLSKSQRGNRETIHTWTCSNTSITPEQSKAYHSALAAGKNRDIANDKRILQLLGMLAKAAPRRTSGAKQLPQSPAQQLNKATAQLNKTLSKRGVDKMSEVERLQLREASRNIATLFVELSA